MSESAIPQNELDQFASQAASVAGSYAAAPAEQSRNVKIDFPGRYRVKVKSIRTKEGKVWPTLEKVQKSGAWAYSLIFEQVDTAEDPLNPGPGASIFDTITVLQPEGATQEKIENTARYAKPKITALSGGNAAFQLGELASRGLDIYGPDGKITRHHEFTHEYMIDVEVNRQTPYKTGTKELNLQVGRIDVAKPGERTIVKPRTVTTSSQAASPSAAPAYNAGSVGPSDAAGGTGAATPYSEPFDDGLPF